MLVGVVEAFSSLPWGAPSFPLPTDYFYWPLKHPSRRLRLCWPLPAGKNDPMIRIPAPELGTMNPGHANLQMSLKPGSAQTPRGPSLRVELLSDIFVFHQVLLYCFKHQAEVIAGLFREVTQGAPNQWFLGDSGSLLSDVCTMHQWQLVSPFLFVCLGIVDGGRETAQGPGASRRMHLLEHALFNFIWYYNILVCAR